MEQSSEYLGLLVTFLIAVGIAGLVIFLNAAWRLWIQAETSRPDFR